MHSPDETGGSRTRVRVVIVNRYFFPDLSATSQMATDVAWHLVISGHDVHVITSRQRYDDAKARLPAFETSGGVTTHRVATTRFGRAGLLGRLIDYASFYVAATIAALRVVKKGSIVIAKTDPPLISVPMAAVAKLKGARLVNWLQDVFPEIAEHLGVGGRISRLAMPVLRKLRNASLLTAAHNVVVGEQMKRRVATAGAPLSSIRVIPNWADGRLIVPVASEQNRLRKEWALGDRFVVGYSGNLGRAHEIDAMVNAMAHVARHSASADIAWLFIGGGKQYDALRQEVARRAIPGILFKPYQPRERLAESLSAADVHLVSLRPELEGLIVPSKYYGIAAAGRPAIFIGDRDGEIASKIAASGGGVTVPSGDGEALARAILVYAADREGAREAGRAARRSFDADDDLTVAMKRWSAVVADVADRQGATAGSP